MLAFLKKPALATALACGALAATAVGARDAPAGDPAIHSGPGERVELRSWILREDPRNRGGSLGWQRGGFSGSPVSVPDTLRAHAYKGHAGILNAEGSVAWYRTTVQTASAGEYALTFQSVNYRADVWLDGRRLGSHHGSYLPFEMRARLASGAHQLVVRVDWRDPAAQSRAGFHRTWFNWGGIDRAVELRPVGESELSTPAISTTLGAGGTGPAAVRVSIQVHNAGAPRTIVPSGSLQRPGSSIPLAFTPVQLGHGQNGTATASVQVAAPALWSPSEPNLYRLAIAVGNESSYSARVGLRELSWHGGRLYLNGRRLLLHGATIQEDSQAHGDALTPSDQDTIVRELKAIGANCARAQHPLDPGLLERLDAAGILVWQGVGPVEGAGNWYSNTPRLLAEAEQQARTAVLADELHPSIVAWNLVDEVARNGRDAAEVAYVQTLTHWLHANDPTRPVAVDVWGDHPPVHAGSLYANVDAIAETDYSGWYDYPTDTRAQLAAAMRRRLSAMQRTFPGRILVISEFGAEANGLNRSSSPGGYSYQARLLREHVAVYSADPKLTGMMIWLLRDYPLTPRFNGGSLHNVLPHVRLIEGINGKGLFARSGHAKPAVRVVARLFRALPGG